MSEKTTGRKQAAIQWLKDNNTYLILLVMIIVSAVISNNFLTAKNLGNLVKQNSIKGMLAMGMLLIIMTGDIDLSVGSLTGASNVLAAVALTDWSMGAGTAIFLAIGVSAAMGIVNGFFIVYRKLPAFIVTLAMMTIARGFAYLWSGGRPISVSDPVLTGIKQSEFLGLPPYVWFFVIIFAIMFVALRYVPYGRIIKAIGSNEQAVRLAGIRVNRYRFSIYVITGLLCGLAGVCSVGRIGSASPLLGEGYEMDAISMVVIGGASLSGGKGDTLKTLAGIFIIGMIGNIMNLMNVSAYWQHVIQGVIILAAIILQVQTGKKKDR
ncbi:MAG: ABC transporter permease [Lachnospiraceae bacterium]|nr:ABC transporter permease [Lachnospiraceae bacterium]